MKVFVIDEMKIRNEQVVELVNQQKGTPVSCLTTNDVMHALTDSQMPDVVLTDWESWNRGRSIYKYFGTAKRLSVVPMVVYNAPEGFMNIAGRERHEKDRVYNKPTQVDVLAEAFV
jgi:hypothetical protein